MGICDNFIILNLSKKLGDIPVLQLVNIPDVIKKINANAWIVSASHFFRIPLKTVKRK